MSQSEKFLLREFVELRYDQAIIKEQIEAKKPVMLSGVCQRAQTKNSNGRIYPRNILQREITNYMKFVKENRAVGELDHPTTSVVELKNASHIVRDLWWEGDDVLGKFEVLNTPNGKTLQSLLESGVQVGVSSRGVGSLKKNGDTDVVEEDFTLICLDIVNDPSTFGAFLVKENRIIDNAYMNNFTKADKLNRILNSILKS